MEKIQEIKEVVLLSFKETRYCFDFGNGRVYRPLFSAFRSADDAFHIATVLGKRRYGTGVVVQKMA